MKRKPKSNMTKLAPPSILALVILGFFLNINIPRFEVVTRPSPPVGGGVFVDVNIPRAIFQPSPTPFLAGLNINIYRKELPIPSQGFQPMFRFNIRTVDLSARYVCVPCDP